MKMQHRFDKKMRNVFALLLLAGSAVLCSSKAQAFSQDEGFLTTDTYIAPHFGEEEMATGDLLLFEDPAQSGFSLSGSYHSGTDADSDLRFARPSLLSEEKAYALLLNGKYDFGPTDRALRPYLTGSLGVALLGYDTNGFKSATPNSAALPLFRLGGGVSYQLDEKWNMALDFKTGLVGHSSAQHIFTGRGQEPIDLQTLNMGVKYKF